MPARELGSSFGPPNGTHAIGTTLLKRHKILPHPREDPAPVHYPSPPPVKPRDLTIDTSVPSKPSSDASSPHILKHTSKRIGGLPPTPPTHSRQSSGSHPVVPSAPRFDVKPLRSPADIPVTPRTPPNQRSPPTPDVTPPRGMPLAFRTPFRPALSDRYPSSRTDSFRTAPENPYSSGDDDEDVSTVRPVLPSARASELTIIPQLPERSVRRKEIGLGLGLESEGTATPRPRGKSPQEAFVVFDGEWGSQVEEASEVEREWDDNLMRNVTVRKRPGRNIHMFTDGATDEVVEDNIVSPNIATRVARSLPLQERIARHRLQRDTADRSSTEKFAQTISWPGEVPDPESPVSADARRVSTMSAKSGYSTVIVDAMVVDAPAQRRKTLRHTKKHLGLRDFSSEHSPASSAPTSVVSSEPPHRLVHKSAGIPKRRHQSLNSSTTVSTTSSSGKSRREVINNGGIPVVVIPDRRSSSKSSKTPSLRSTSSHKTKRSNSLNSAPISHSAKFNEPGYFDVPRHKRTMSESASSAVSERTMDFPPNIPARRSSLSAPTSRNTSRAGSLTTESLKAHNILQARKQEIKSVEVPKTQSQSSPESHRGRYKSSVDHNGDPFFGNRLSAQATPFSQTSYETTGTTAEVSEAMMVNIFPHQNKSVLVVQHENSPIDASSKDLPMANELEKVESVQPPKQPTMAINDEPTTGPVTPPQPIHPMDAVDSPLRNPRAPPAPPAIKFIPPTPAGLTPGHEEERQLGYDPNEVRPNTSDEKPKRGLSIVRRALSKRRNSESAVSTGSLLRETFFLPQKKKESTDESTQTSKGEANPSSLYPTVADRPPDGSKLHPFWRPTHFWDDLEDRDEEDYADDELGYYPMIDNRPGPPKRSLSSTLKRTFAILPIQDENRYESDRYPTERRTMRRSASGNMKVVKQRSQSSLRRGSSSPPTTRYRGAVLKEGDFGYGFKDGNGGKREGGYLIPGLGVRVEYVGWGGMKRKIRDKRRAQRSDKLRGTISSPRGVRSGMDDVLRRRSQI